MTTKRTDADSTQVSKVSKDIPRQASVRSGAREQFKLEILGENAGNQTKRNKGREHDFLVLGRNTDVRNV